MNGQFTAEFGDRTTTLHTKCPFCLKEHSITVTMEFEEFNKAWNRYCNGELVQNAFPNWTPDQREFIITGICPNCWPD